MINGHFSPQIQRAFRVGGAGGDGGGAGADHEGVEESIGVRVCNVSHVGKEVPGLGTRYGRGQGEEGCEEEGIGGHRGWVRLGFVGVEDG